MSRVGKKVVVMPAGVTVSVEGSLLTVKGPKGSLQRVLPAGVGVAVDGQEARVELDASGVAGGAVHGLVRALLANMVKGVTAGFEKRLEIQGIGYKAEVKGSVLNLSLGYSHQVEYPFPAGITVKVEAGTKLVVAGMDREAVGQAAANIRSFRPPDHYKGKGVRYSGETVRLKAGKSQ